jgi:hypothetical protein
MNVPPMKSVLQIITTSALATQLASAFNRDIAAVPAVRVIDPVITMYATVCSAAGSAKQILPCNGDATRTLGSGVSFLAAAGGGTWRRAIGFVDVGINNLFKVGRANVVDGLADKASWQVARLGNPSH